MMIKSTSFHAEWVSRGDAKSAAYCVAYAQGKSYRDKFYSKTFYVQKRNDLVHDELMLPKRAPVKYRDIQAFLDAWNDSEKRADALLAINYRLALPCELDEVDRLNLARSFAQEHFVKHGFPVFIAIHRGSASEHPKSSSIQAVTERCDNPHVHMLVALRTVGEHGFSPTKYPGRSMCQKKFLRQLRESWANQQNQLFEQRRLAVRVTASSYKDRGISMTPTPHLGPWVERLEAAGIKTALGERYRQVLSRNQQNAHKIEAQLKHEAELAMELENEYEIAFEM